MGLLPDPAQLTHVLSALGLTPDTHVVTYDDEGGGRACRLLWTLEAAGHRRFSLLNGGLRTWANQNHEISTEITWPTAGHYEVNMDFDGVATRQYILDHLSDASVALLDVRSPAEYQGRKVYAQRGGHIPGAVNLEWTEAMDPQHDLCLKPAAELRDRLAGLGITPDKEVVTYCQTHHRSSHTYFVLKQLGYPRVRGYHGAWSDWGNADDTPVEA